MTTETILDASLTQYVGTPGPEVTHWGMWKVGPGGKETRMSVMAPNGVSSDLWPLSELSLEEVRNRWGGGEYKCIWMVEDPQNPQPEARRRSGGRGRLFKIADPMQPTFQIPTATMHGGGMGAFGDLERAVTLMGMIGQMSAQNRTPIVGDNRNVDLAAELAGVRAELKADRELRAIEDKHRREIDDMRDSLREARQKIRRLEEDAERGPGFSLKEGDGVWDVVKRHFASDPGKAIKQLTDFFRTTPMVLGAVMKAAEAAQQAPNPQSPRPRAKLAVVPPPADAPPPPAPKPPPAPPQVQTLDLAAFAEAGEPRKKAPPTP